MLSERPLAPVLANAMVVTHRATFFERFFDNNPLQRWW